MMISYNNKTVEHSPILINTDFQESLQALIGDMQGLQTLTAKYHAQFSEIQNMPAITITSEFAKKMNQIQPEVNIHIVANNLANSESAKSLQYQINQIQSTFEKAADGLMDCREEINNKIRKLLLAIKESSDSCNEWIPVVAKKIGGCRWAICAAGFDGVEASCTINLMRGISGEDDANIEDFFKDIYIENNNRKLISSITNKLSSPLLGATQFLPMAQTSIELYQGGKYAQALTLILPVIEGVFVHYYSHSLKDFDGGYLSPAKPALVAYGKEVADENEHLKRLILMTLLECYSTIWQRGKDKSQLNRNVILHGCSLYEYTEVDIVKAYALLAAMLDESDSFTNRIPSSS